MAEKPEKESDRDEMPDEDELRRALKQIKFRANRGTYLVLPRSPGSLEDK